MSRRFSSKQLFDLRNHIPITVLIEEVLSLSTRRTDGYLRFNCPICGGFHTAVNPGKNLARCFDCRKNFNPIDLVMCCRKIGFIESVDFLKQLAPCRQAPAQDLKIGGPPATSSQNSKPADADNSSFQSIGQILSQMALADKSKAVEENPAHAPSLIRRIEILEQKVAMLVNLLSHRK